VIGLVADRRDQARLAGALRGFARFRVATTLDQCRVLLHEELATVAALIVEAQDTSGVPTLSFVAQLSTTLPAVPIIGYCDVGARKGGDAVALARAGVHDIVLRGVDDGVLALRDALVAAAHSTGAKRVMAAVEPFIQRSVLPLIQYGLTYGRRAVSVTGAAVALGVHRKTLVNQCSRAKLPSPAIILGWCRIFLVAALLERQPYTVERIAHELEYPSSTALRNMLRRYVGFTASDIRARGGLQFVLERFERAVLQCRSGIAGAHPEPARHYPTAY
jgi:AraC-like DNA-binding protein